MSRSGEENPVLSRRISEFLEEDVGFGDITTDAVINPDAQAEGRIISREDAVVSGVEEAVLTFRLLGCSARRLVKEGEAVEGGRTILEVTGRASAILKGERTALNIFGRMSGVATATRRLVEEAAKIDPDVRIAATRKTLPGFRLFDKKAVQSGGGDAHRFCLDDAVLIKDNHVRIAGSVSRAIGLARKVVSFTKKIEAESSSFEEALEAAEAGADIVMLDNLSPETVSRVVEALRERGLRERVLLEASGRIGPENLRQYCEAGVDVISSGGITHSARSIDFSLEISKKEA